MQEYAYTDVKRTVHFPHSEISETRSSSTGKSAYALVKSPNMRVLGRIRLSRATEESTSAERQREVIQQWAGTNGHRVIGWAEDIDVSGSVDPWDTPILGRWLTDEKKHEWDILCAWKLDRITRRAIPMGRMFEWLMDNEKGLVCTADSIDLSTPMGRLIAYVIATIAEGELEAIRERTRSSQKKLRELGRWGGGIVFYGFKPAEHPTSAGWVWERDEHSSRVLMEIINEVLSGKPTESIAGMLNERGELAPSDYTRKRAGKPAQGKKWSNTGIRTLLQSKSLLGHMTHQGVTVRDDEGNPIRKGPELIQVDLYERIQTELSRRSFTVTNRTKASPLLGVAFCLLCGRLMHLRQHHSKARGKTYRYYQCLGGKSGGGGGAGVDHKPNIIKAADLEDWLEKKFLEELGDENVRERRYTPPQDHQIELEAARSAVEELTGLLGTMTSETVRSRLYGQLSVLDHKILSLEQMPTRESGWELVRTDETYREAWERSDTEGRRQLLIRSEITATVRCQEGGLWLNLKHPPDILERIA